MPSLIGNKPNQVPSNGDLGTLAFQDANAVNITGGIVDVSAGTAALPSLGTTGDPDTGVFFPAANTIAASTNGVERMRIDANGSVGIGITPYGWTNSQALVMGKSGAGNPTYPAISSTNSQILDLTSNAYHDGTNWKYTFPSSIPAMRQSIVYNEIAWYTAANGTQGNNISWTAAMTLDAGGGIKCRNTVGVGNATPSNSGAGITFPATQSASSDANTLDDYEEGTWTPSIGGTATYNNRVGTYTKIGNVVTAYCVLNIASIGTGLTGRINGLPFSSARRSQGSLAFYATLSQSTVFLAPFAEGTDISFVGTTSATTTVTDGISIFQNGAYVILNVTYSVS